MTYRFDRRVAQGPLLHTARKLRTYAAFPLKRQILGTDIVVEMGPPSPDTEDPGERRR